MPLFVALALALHASAAWASPSYLRLTPTIHHHAPSPAAKLVFAQGPHPVCLEAKQRSPLKDACALHSHLTGPALQAKPLQAIAQRVLKTLERGDQDLLRARLLGAKARRSAPCLQQAGSGIFAADETRLILTRQRDALQAYARALKGMDRAHAGPLVEELMGIMRIPYERLAAQTTPPIDAGFAVEIELLPQALIAAGKHLARSVGHTLPKAVLAPIAIATRRRSEARRLWREGSELLVRTPGSVEALRLRGDAATEALRKRLVADHDDVVMAAHLAGILGFAPLHQQLVFLSELENETLSRAGWIGRVGLAHASDHDAIVKWLTKTRPEVSPELERALRRFSDLAGNRIKSVLPTQWPVDVLRSMVSHSARFDQRAWYTALLGHPSPAVRVLAHAAMRKTKPEDWLTARLDKTNHCAAEHLRLLVPSQAPVRVIKSARPPKASDKGQATPDLSEDIDDGAGSVEVPEDDDPTAD